VADDDVPPDLLREIEAVFAADDSVLEVARETFMSQPSPGVDRLRGVIERDTEVDRFNQDDDEAAQADEDWGQESVEARTRKVLRGFAIVCLCASCFLLYSQWMVGLGGGSKFRFALENTWPVLVSVGMTAGLYAEQVAAWGCHHLFMLGQWRRHNSLFLRWRVWRDAPAWQHTHCVCRNCQRHERVHWSICRCWRCKLKRRWTFWRRGKRYRPN
jgi:hypothetical protein